MPFNQRHVVQSKTDPAKAGYQSDSYRARKLKSFRLPETVVSQMEEYADALGLKVSRAWDRLFQLFVTEARAVTMGELTDLPEPPDLAPDGGDRRLVSYTFDSDTHETIARLGEETGLSQARVLEVIFWLFQGRLEADVEKNRLGKSGIAVLKEMSGRIKKATREDDRWRFNARAQKGASKAGKAKKAVASKKKSVAKKKAAAKKKR